MGSVHLHPEAAWKQLARARRFLPHFLLLTILVLALITLPGCQGGFARYSGTNRIKVLHEAVVDYNRYLRWQEWERASDFIRDAERIAFKQRFYEIEEDLRITEFEIRDTDVAKEGAKSADVVVLYHYYLLPSVREKKIRVTQRWIWSEEENLWAVEEPLAFLRTIMKPTASRRSVRTVLNAGAGNAP